MGASKKSPRATSMPLSDDLLENPDLLLQIIDCIFNGFALFAPDDRLIAYNEEYCSFSGLSKKDLSGNPSYKHSSEQSGRKKQSQLHWNDRKAMDQ